MTIRAASKVLSSGQNGVGAFILQCKKMDLHYCDWAGSSKGMNAFISNHLSKFIAKNPQIEFSVSPKPSKHPEIVGHYINGNRKSICVKNLESTQIMKYVEKLRDSTGEKDKKFGKPVTSVNDSVRGIWSPYHGNGITV